VVPPAVDQTFTQHSWTKTAAGSGGAAAIDAERWLADHARIHTAHETAEPVSDNHATTPAN
jgi:thioredoxin reductase (NADPH)